MRTKDQQQTSWFDASQKSRAAIVKVVAVARFSSRQYPHDISITFRHRLLFRTVRDKVGARAGPLLGMGTVSAPMRPAVCSKIEIRT